MHFERDYEDVFRRAVECYQNVGTRYGIEMHSAKNHLAILEQYLVDGKFNLEAFARYSSARSSAAAKREAMTVHDLEELSDGNKAYCELVNYQGGIYHLTADGVYWEDGRLVIQESKNATKGKMPGLRCSDMVLFQKLLSTVFTSFTRQRRDRTFATRIKLTGKLREAKVNLRK